MSAPDITWLQALAELRRVFPTQAISCLAHWSDGDTVGGAGFNIQVGGREDEISTRGYTPTLREAVDAVLAQAPKPNLDVDWDKVPAWLNYAAADEDGKVYVYGNEPAPISSLWLSSGNDDYQAQLHPSAYRPFTGDWRESLTQRPEGSK